MGCCLGTTASAAANGRQPHPPNPKTQPPIPSPPPAFEEETVKEVLSETPIVPKPPPPVTVHHPETPQPEKPTAESGGADLTKTKTPTDEIQENGSEMSEMFSYSESFSAATTATVADTKRDEIEIDDDGEVNQKVKNRSPPAKRVTRKRPAVSSGDTGKKDKGVRPSGRREMVPSPEKKGRLPARSTTGVQRQRNVGPVNDGRREPGARRSRSPAVRGEAGQRRKVRERSPAEKSVDVVAADAVESEAKGTVEMAEDGGASPEPQTSESLENPLVSLECFIFL